MDNVMLLAAYKISVELAQYKDLLTDVSQVDEITFDDEINKITMSPTTGDMTLRIDGLTTGQQYRFSINMVKYNSGQKFLEIHNGSTVILYPQVGIRTKVFTAETTYLDIIMDNNNSCSFRDVSIEQINYTNIDLSSNLDVLLNYEAVNIEDITQKKYVYSKEILLPATADNKRFFKFYFDTNQFSYFNFKKKIKAMVSFNGITYRDGYLQINKYDNGEFYNALFYEDVVDFVTTLGDKELVDLTLTDYDHTNYASTISGSWSSFPTIDYVYPFVDYGGSYRGIMGNAFQYTTSHNLYTTGPGNVGHDLFPSMKVKYVFDKIVSEAGYTYSSNFLNGDMFKQLVLPFTNDVSDLDGYEGLCFGVTSGGGINDFNMQMFIGSGGYLSDTNVESYFLDLMTDEQPQNSYKNRTLCPVKFKNTTYDLYFSYNYFNNSNSIANATSEVYVELPDFTSSDLIKKYGPEWTYRVKKGSSYKCKGNITTNSTHFVDGTKLDFYWVKIPVGVVEWTTATFESYGPFEYKLSTTISANGTWNLGQHTFKNCMEGDIIYLACVISDNSTASSEAWTFGISGNWYLYDMEYSQNQSIKGSDVIPKDVKQYDFLKDVFTMFNLQMETDEQNDKNLLIEPRDDYYDAGSGTTYNWTHKVDLDTINYRIPSWESPSMYHFTLTPDNDEYFSWYNRNRDLPGYKKNDMNNDHTKAIKKIQPEFTWYAVDNILGYKDDDNLPQIVCTRMLPVDNEGVHTVKLLNRDTKRQITMGFFNYRPIIDQSSNNVAYYFNNVAYTSYPYYGTYLYPYGSHESNNTNYDINFNQTISYNSDWTEITNNNLYNLYYRNQLEQIKDKDAHILEAFFNLNSYDILNLNFNNPVFVNGTYYDVLKIKDFNPNTLTKVELLKKVITPTSFDTIITGVTSSASAGGGGGLVIGEGSVGTVGATGAITPGNGNGNGNGHILVGNFNTVTYREDNTNNNKTAVVYGNNNSILDGGAIIEGDFNLVQDGGVVINGDNNVVGKDGDATIIGSSNVVVKGSGSTNVVIIGKDGGEITITDTGSTTIYLGDMVIENGVLKSEGNVKEGGFEEVQNAFGIDIIDVSDGGYDSVRIPGSDRVRNVSDGGLNRV